MNATEGDAGTASWVPVTKLVPPVVGPEVTIDPGRLEWIRDVIRRHRLTSLVAQGGSGKSTLAAAAVAGLDMPVAWVRWHADDDDAVRVVEYLSLALAHADRTRTGAVTVVRSTGAALTVEQLVGLLVNDLVALGPVVVVLDDLHLLRSAEALGVVAALLDLAPADTHVVVTARSMPEMPLARLHAAGRWARLTADDLRVDESTAVETLHRHRIDLPPERAVALASEINGWMVGFLLAARAEASGRPRGGRGPVVADYLAEEVLADETPSVRRFLQDTSIVDTLDAQVCDVVTGRHDSAAILGQLRDRLGFLVIEHGEHLRLHDLLRDHVRAELAATASHDHVAGLHRRAATATDGDDRVEHLLAAEEYASAAVAIEARSRAWVRHPATDHQATGWITRLPPEVRIAHPWLDVTLATASALGHNAADVVPLLLDALTRAADDDVELQWLASRLLLVATMDLERWTPLVDRASELDRQRLHPVLRVEALLAVAWTEHWSAHPDEAYARASAAMDIVEATGDAVAAESLAMHLATPLACSPGAVDRILRYHRGAAERFGARSRLVDVASRAHAAQLETLRSGPTAAGTLSPADLDLLANLPMMTLSRLWMLAARAIHAGDAAGVEAALAGPILGARSPQLLPFSALLSASYRAQRRPDDLRRLTAMLAAAPAQFRASPTGRSLGAQLDAELRWAEGNHAEAVDVLRALVGAPDKVVTGPIPDAGCLLAAVLDEAGEQAEALAVLAARVEDLSGRLGSPFRVRQALPYGSDLLARLADRGHSAALDAVRALDRGPVGPLPLAVPGTGEVLTVREVEVLELLAQGHSNAEIATALYVSANTVKTHVRRVLTKLGASSRSAAVARAREHGLL